MTRRESEHASKSPSLTLLLASQVSPFHENFEQYSAACKQKARAASAACCPARELTRCAHLQSFLKAVAEAQHFVATGGAAGGELPAGMTGLYEGKGIGDMVLKPKARLLLVLAHGCCAAHEVVHR